MAYCVYPIVSSNLPTGSAARVPFVASAGTSGTMCLTVVVIGGTGATPTINVYFGAAIDVGVITVDTLNTSVNATIPPYAYTVDYTPLTPPSSYQPTGALYVQLTFAAVTPGDTIDGNAMSIEITSGGGQSFGFIVADNAIDLPDLAAPQLRVEGPLQVTGQSTLASANVTAGLQVGGTSVLAGVTATSANVSGALQVSGTSMLAGVTATSAKLTGNLQVASTSSLATVLAGNVTASNVKINGTAIKGSTNRRPGTLTVDGSASVTDTGEEAAAAVYASSTNNDGVFAISNRGDALVGFGNGAGVGLLALGFPQSAQFIGNVDILDGGITVDGDSEIDGTTTIYGDLHVQGNIFNTWGGVTSDHPLDPTHRYLHHSFVESPERKNLYDGVAVCDAQGNAVVSLPAWFAPLNTELRYQLTAIGAAAPNLHVAEKVAGGRFKIGGGAAGLEVCWLVTGLRHVAWAKARPLHVEEEKAPAHRGTYLHPEAHGQPSPAPRTEPEGRARARARAKALADRHQKKG